MNEHAEPRTERPKRTLFLVDEDAAFRTSLAKYLKTSGYAVQEFSNGPVALLAAQESAPDALLVGEDSSGTDGLSVASAARQLDYGAKLPILRLGSLAKHQHGIIDFHLAKPFQYAQVLRVLRALDDNGKMVRPAVPLHQNAARLLGDAPKSGRLGRIPFAQIYCRYWRSAVTGVLMLKAGKTWRQLQFINGFPVAARSGLITEQVLGYLLRLNLISPEIYRKNLQRAHEKGFDAHAALVETGQVSSEDFQSARVRLVQEILQHCFRWSGAAFRLREVTHQRAEGAPPLSLNPFTIYRRWLADPANEPATSKRVSGILPKALISSPALPSYMPLIEAEFSDIPQAQLQFDSPVKVSETLEAADGARLGTVLLTLIDLGAVRPISVERAITRRVSARLDPQQPGRRFERVRKMLDADWERVERAKSAKAALGLPASAGAHEVELAYRRFHRLYRAGNFERVEDTELKTRAGDLLAALSQAAEEVLGSVPDQVERPAVRQNLDPSTTSSRLRAVNPDAGVLARVFFDDGDTYLRLADFAEAHHHFERAHDLAPEQPKFLAYLGWAVFQLGQSDGQRVDQARQMLSKALKKDARNDRALYFLGCIYEELGRDDQAGDCWKQAIRINAGNYEARTALQRIASS